MIFENRIMVLSNSDEKCRPRSLESRTVYLEIIGLR